MKLSKYASTVVAIEKQKFKNKGTLNFVLALTLLIVGFQACINVGKALWPDDI